MYVDDDGLWNKIQQIMLLIFLCAVYYNNLRVDFDFKLNAALAVAAVTE